MFYVLTWQHLVSLQSALMTRLGGIPLPQVYASDSYWCHANKNLSPLLRGEIGGASVADLLIRSLLPPCFLLRGSSSAVYSPFHPIGGGLRRLSRNQSNPLSWKMKREGSGSGMVSMHRHQGEGLGSLAEGLRKDLVPESSWSPSLWIPLNLNFLNKIPFKFAWIVSLKIFF